MDPSAGRRPIAFAHRGASAHKRENTLEAFTLALRLGATGLESDAWLTADGEVVLDHDGVARRFLRRAPIAGMRRAELPSHVPSLSDLYRECGADFELSLDVKDPAALGPLLETAASRGDPARLWLCHGDPGMLTRWRGGVGRANLVNSTRLPKVREGLPARARALAEAGVAALNLPAPDWTLEGVVEVHGAGVRAFGWDAQSESRIRSLVRAGVDGIYSDHVDRMLRVIGEASEPPES